MDYTELINASLERLQLDPEDVHAITIYKTEHRIVVLTTWYAKFADTFPADDDAADYNQDPEPRRQTKRVKAIKKVA